MIEVRVTVPCIMCAKPMNIGVDVQGPFSQELGWGAIWQKVNCPNCGFMSQVLLQAEPLETDMSESIPISTLSADGNYDPERCDG